MFMLKVTVQQSVKLILCGQTAFANEQGKSEKAAGKSVCAFSLAPFAFLILPFVFSFLPTAQTNGQCALVCHNNITVGLNADGEAPIYPPMLLQSSVGCSNNYSIEIFDTTGLDRGTVLTADLLGMPLLAVLTHPASGNSCNTNITLIDAMAPVMDCGFDTVFIWCSEPNLPDSLGIPTVADNASPTDSIDLVFSDTFTDLECFDSVSGKPVTAYIKRTWTATDESGNTSSCTQHIFFKRALLSQVVFPDDRNGIEAPKMQCGIDDPDSLELAGRPSVAGFPLSVAGNCELIASFSDQLVPICGGSRKIYRTWTVFDLCTETFLVNVQTIILQDNTPPTITCPAPVSFETYTSSCSAQVWLPQATATDACSGALVTTSWDYGTGYGPFNAVPAGTHTVTYTAKDGCNNISTCQMTVTVTDTKKPTALCQLQVQVSLEEDGTALVFAESFNNGSYDNCAIAEYLVKRNSDPFDTFVEFQCSDMGTAPKVTLRVVDASGLWKECTSTVLVVDQIAPEILCPANTSINCGQNYNDLNLTGQPYATDNCTVASVTHTNQVNLNNCGNGTVTRTWKATDQTGSQSTCVQIITVADNTSITVSFPDDLEYYECGPDLDPSVTGEPVVIGADCEQLQVTHTDYYFYTAEPSCFQLIRKWGVVDWCSYQPNNPSSGGFWEHTQIIEVRDDTPPVLTCPANMTVGIDGASCNTFVNVPLPAIDDCSETLTISNDSEFAQTQQNDASGTYPKGNWTFNYTVSDGCGNTSTCAMTVTVVDSEAPNPVCNNGVSVTIQQNGYITLTPSMINVGSYDNCSPTNTLILQVSPNTFTCQDVGTKVVTLTVTDQSGNSAFCQTNVVVQDNFSVCGSGTIATIAGKMETEDGEALSQKLVGLSGGINNATYCDVDGTYAFPNLPLGQNYTVKPSYNVKPLNGVTTFDLVLIQRHILGTVKLDTPYKMIAADANGSKSVTTFDLVTIRKLILIVDTAFPNGVKSWRFVPASYVFPNPENPWLETVPDAISIQNLSSNAWNRDFVGIKIGDVNGSADPASFDGGGTDDRNFDNQLIFNTRNAELVAGHEIAIPFVASSSQPVAGFQFTLDFAENALEYRGLKQGGALGLSANNFGEKHAADGALTVSWENVAGHEFAAGETLFTLVFLAKENARLADVLTINSRLTPAEAYGGNLHSSAGLELMGVALQHDEITANIRENTLQLFQNTPNPFYEKTTVGFQLPKAMDVTLRIFDLRGQLLQIHEANYPPGRHELLLDLGDETANGLIYCQLQAGNETPLTIRMVRLE